MAAVDGLGNEPPALGISFVLQGARQMQLVKAVWVLSKWTQHQNISTFDKCITL